MKQYSFCLIVTAVLAGCSATPTVKYKQVVTAKDMSGMSDAYFLQKSVISVKLEEQAKTDGSGKIVSILTVNSIPREDASKKLAIKPRKTWTGNTTVAITKQDNTDLPAAIGSEVSNAVVENIAEAGSVIVKAVGMIGLAGAADSSVKRCIDPDKPALVLTPQPKSELDTHATNSEHLNGNARGAEIGCITISYDPLPPDAQPFSADVFNQDSSMFYYAACRRAKVSVTHLGNVLTAEVRISDPSFIQAVEFPAKGSLKLHSQCGVSVITEKASNEVALSAIFEALSAQQKAIKAALEATANAK